MIHYTNGGRLVQTIAELPNLDNVTTLYLDFETTSGNRKKKSLNPWHDCAIAGIAITVDDIIGAWYVPIGHREIHAHANLPRDAVLRWLFDIIRTCRRWVNHNIKYDAHVICNDGGLPPSVLTAIDRISLVDTLTMAKLVDSDRLQHNLTALARDWLQEDISHYEQELQVYLGKQNYDYGLIPADKLGEYACQDVITVRRLYKFINETLAPECHAVRDTEVELTTVLFDMERQGLRVDLKELQRKEFLLLNECMMIEEELAKLVGRPFNPASSDQCNDVLIGQYGLPIMGWTQGDEDDPEEERGGASFDKYALAAYMAYPYSPHRVIELIAQYRKRNILRGLFVEPFQALQINGVLHSYYNQSVRTGRLSCGQPNAQQQNKESKALIHPEPGCAFLSYDFSQIEYRVIAHFTQEPVLINAYNTDPKTDFHDYVAKLFGIKRRPAKTMNFAIAFGMGKKKTKKRLAEDPDIIGNLKDEIEAGIAAGVYVEAQRAQLYKILSDDRAERVFNEYHATFPRIRSTARQAELVARQRGYVFNLAGRRRRLPASRAHIAFNTLNQSSAADIQKERTVAVWRRLQGTPITVKATIHDATLFNGPVELMRDQRTQRDLAYIMEHSRIKLRVPIYVSGGYSAKNWAEADSDEGAIDCSGQQFGDLKHV